MTDRELLELAAKAAGMEFGKAQECKWFYCEVGQAGEAIYKIRGNTIEAWNPLTDDGDALRLAVKLRIRHERHISHPYVAAFSNEITGKFEESEGADPYAATRRAIVRAAAEIGKIM